jgi:hypothetical protein
MSIARSMVVLEHACGVCALGNVQSGSRRKKRMMSRGNGDEAQHLHLFGIFFSKAFSSFGQRMRIN